MSKTRFVARHEDETFIVERRLDRDRVSHMAVLRYGDIPPGSHRLSISRETKPAHDELVVGTLEHCRTVASHMRSQHPAARWLRGVLILPLED